MKRANVEQTRQDADTLVNAVYQAATVLEFLQGQIAHGSLHRNGAEVAAIVDLCGMAMRRIAMAEGDRLEAFVRRLSSEDDT